MRSLFRKSAIPLLVALGLLVGATTSEAQGFGIGARMAWVTADSELDVDSVRFIGGQIRLGLSQRLGVEVALDRHTEEFEALNQKVTETPLQISLLLKLASGSFQPYLLGGPGWYKRSVEPIEGPAEDLELSTREFGWHAGGGVEVRLGRHVGIHGDYRYTFLDFGDDDDDDDGFIGGLLPNLPGHRGSMWTLGASVYF
jgi:opacity protein-like surface antigen